MGHVAEWGAPFSHGAAQESVVKMGIASRAEIENWFTVETLGVSG